LRAEAGGAAKLAVAAGGTLAGVLDEIGARWPRLERRVRDERGQIRRYVNVYVNGESGGRDTPIPEGAEIQILPSIAGG
jgi:molybdopterin converting factor small subunit